MNNILMRTAILATQTTTTEYTMFKPVRKKILYLANSLKPLGVPCLILAIALCGFMWLWPDTDVSRKVKKYLPLAIAGCFFVVACTTIGNAIGKGLEL